MFCKFLKIDSFEKRRRETAVDFLKRGSFMKKKIKLFGLFSILLTAILAFNSNIKAQTKNEILIVGDTTSKCVTTEKRDCLRVRRLNEEQFTSMYEPIQNFKFVPGYFYVLDVKVTTGRIPPTGFPKYTYQLRKVLARVKAENTAPLERRELSGIHWILLRIEGEKVNTTKAFIQFDETKKSAGGNGGCNAFGGSFSKNGYQIKISQIMSTKMFCEETSGIENKFLENLEKVTSYEFVKGKLNLLAGDRVVLEFGAPVD
jgi:heat shock protein HslJ